MPALDYELIKMWLPEVAAAHGMRVGSLCYCFCNDDHILEVNNEFLNHDYFTDIITFDYSSGGRVSGDMVISLDTVRTNAEGCHVPYAAELMRVIVHGLLHLCGIGDKGPGEREVMERHENEALAIYERMRDGVKGAYA